jgi:hypothetical protein
MSFALHGSALTPIVATNDNIVQLGGLKSRPPADWVQQPSDDPTWRRQYRLEPVADDKDNADVTIFALGQSKAATAEDYVKRWKEKFLPPIGQTVDEAASLRRFTVGGAPVTLLDIHGDYKGIPGNPDTPRANFRLLGVYFDTPRSAFVIQLFGPADTVAYYRGGFVDWVKAFK